MKQIATTRDFAGTLSELNASNYKFEVLSRIYVTGDPTRYKIANGIDTFANLPWIQSNVKQLDGVAINATAVATADQLKTGLITSTSAGATSITLPSAALLLAAIKSGAKSSFDLLVDNSAGASLVTIVPSATILAATPVITGGATLTVAAGAVGLFKMYFPSASTSVIYRIG
jgi:hypothetical protein